MPPAPPTQTVTPGRTSSIPPSPTSLAGAQEDTPTPFIEPRPTPPVASTPTTIVQAKTVNLDVPKPPQEVPLRRAGRRRLVGEIALGLMVLLIVGSFYTFLRRGGAR